MNIEDQILSEINSKWKEYSKNLVDNTTKEISNQYVNMLLFFDSIFPDINSDEISHYNIVKTIIISHLRDELIKDIKETKYQDIVADAYNKVKK